MLGVWPNDYSKMYGHALAHRSVWYLNIIAFLGAYMWIWKANITEDSYKQMYHDRSNESCKVVIAGSFWCYYFSLSSNHTKNIQMRLKLGLVIVKFFKVYNYQFTTSTMFAEMLS